VDKQPWRPALSTVLGRPARPPGRHAVAVAPACRVSTLENGFRPLKLAAFFGRAGTLLVLVEQGADPNLAARNPMRVRPIHSAAAHRRPEVAQGIVEHLLAHGADANVAQHGGWTPLHQAADHGHLGLVQILLEHGANPQARSDDGRLPVDMAREKGFDHVVEILQS
jgi:uncharacterized protein